MTVGQGLRLGLRLKYIPQCDKVTITNEKKKSAILLLKLTT